MGRVLNYRVVSFLRRFKGVRLGGVHIFWVVSLLRRF